MRTHLIVMPIILVFNPGSASLKFEVVEASSEQRCASEGKKLVSASIEWIGKGAKLLVFDGPRIDRTEPCDVKDMSEGTRFALSWIRTQGGSERPLLDDLELAGVRVVHGGERYVSAVRFNNEVRQEIVRLEELAPLHNKSSIEILAVLLEELPETPLTVAFDTAFHRSIPEFAWRYPIEQETADRHGIRKFGFHGLSHRYMLEQYAQISGKRAGEVSIVTLHLEGGSSATAISKGRSVDNTMGLTPLEGLMMGTRCGSIDPSIVPYLMRKESTGSDEVMKLLNKRSGLLGIAGGTFDTRELVKRDDDAARLALKMFAYRVRLAAGAYLAALGDAEAILFGGGIGENTPSVRAEVCEGLKNWGLELDEEVNARATSGQACLTRPGSRLHAYAMRVEEGLQIAHECLLALQQE